MADDSSSEPKQMPSRGRSYWQRRGGMGAPAPHHQPPSNSDFILVGAGFAGLSTALALADAEPRAQILILEANVPGFGASGRNAGLLGPIPAPIWLLTAAHDPEHAWATGELYGRVLDIADRLAKLPGGADATPADLRIEAKGRITEAGLGRVARGMAAAGLPVAYRRGESGRLAIDLATHTIDPYRAVAALAKEGRARGVTILEGAPVTRIAETKDGVRVTLSDGAHIEARRAIVCTNAYSGSIELPCDIPAKAVYTFMFAAPRTAAGDAAARFVVELNTDYIYYRQHKDNVVYGGIERFKPYGDSDFAVPPDVQAKLERRAARSFPQDRLVPSDSWSGCYHQTSTDLPLLRTAGDKGQIVLNVGYGGTGVAMSMICAPIAAALARDGQFHNDDDRRLHDAIKQTRLPIGGLARLVAGATTDLLLFRKPI